jgi:hypothetical protein
LPNSLPSSLGVLPSKLKQASEVEVPRKETVAQPSCHVCRNSLETWHDFMLKAPQVKTEQQFGNSKIKFRCQALRSAQFKQCVK